MDKQKQRLEQLVRQGIVPVSKLPMLQSALANLNMGKELKPMERAVLSKYITNIQDLVYGDDTVYNRAKLHIQRNKYQTEETTVEIDENVRVVDGPEEMEVRAREKDERKAKRLSIRKREKYRLLSPELKKEKKKAGLDEDVFEINNTYQQMFELALEQYGVSNIRDLSEDKKAEFFSVVDMALEEAKMAKKDHDGDGKIETSTAEYMGSKDKAIKKAIKLKGFGPDKAKGNMGNPAARAALMRKEETELTFEEMTPAQKADRLRMIMRAADRVQTGARNKSAKAIAKSDMKQKGAQKGMAPLKKDVEEQVKELRKMIREGNDKIEAYKLLAKILNNKENSGEL